MADTFVPVTFVADELLTSTKMNILAANQARFNDGTGLGDGIIVTRHLNDGSVLSTKLAEAFFKGRKQAFNTNSLVSGYKIEHGWTYVQGNNTTTLNRAVTFPTAFSAPPVVLICFTAAALTSEGAPADTSAFTTGWSSIPTMNADDVTSAGFNAVWLASTSHSSSYYFGASWIAIGPA